MKKKSYDDDDGRVIADMDVEGMPYNSGIWGYLRHRRLESRNAREIPPAEKDTPRQTLSIVLNAMLAGLTAALIFGGLGFLFILFCTNVWFA